MPLDPRIILGGQPAPVQNPMEALSSIAQLQGIREQTEARRLAADAARQKAMDEAAIRNVMTQTGGDFDKALPLLRQINPRAALAFQTDLGKQREAEFKGLKEKMDYTTKQFDVGDRLLAYAHDEPSFQVVRPMIAQLSPDIATQLGETYDPARVQGVRDMAKTSKERHDQELEGMKLITEGKLVPGINTIFGTADSPEKWTGYQNLAQRFGVAPEVIDAIGPYSPENVARAKANALTPEKTAELAGQAETRAQTKAHQTVEEANAAAQLAISRGQLGVAQGNLAQRIKEANMPGAGKPPTEGERKAAGFYGQMSQALTNIRALESKLTDKDLYQIQSLPQEGISGAINRGVMSDNAKRYIQAFNQFTEARLRPVSGAAISASEYERDRATYGRQYAETPDLATQREAARVQALEALRVMGGSAIQQAPAAPSGGGGGTTTAAASAPKKNPFLK